MPFDPRGRPKRGGRDGDADSPPDGVDATILRTPGPPRRPPARAGAQPVEPEDAGGPRLVDFAAAWLSTILALRHVRELPEAETLRQRMLVLKKEFERASSLQGVSQQAVEDCLVALIALLDETVLGGRGKGSEAWRRNPLMEIVYGHQLGGEEFYIRLDRLRTQPEANERVLELYAFCLALGFRGRLAGMDELVRTRREVLEQVASLRRGAKPPLSPNFEWHQDLPPDFRHWFRWWMPPPAAFLAILLTWIAVKLFAIWEAGSIANEIVQVVRP